MKLFASFFLLSLLICLPVNAEKKNLRIITLSPHAVEMLYSIGAGDLIVATVEYSDFPKEALKIPRIGNYTGIQIEKVLALEPDVVIAWKSGNKSNDLQKLESLGLNIHYTHAKSMSDISHEIRRLGDLLGKQAQALVVTNKLNKRYKEIKNTYKDKKLVSVFYQLWHEPLQSVGETGWIASLIKDCGGLNLFNKVKTAYPAVSMETVLVKNPKVIIIPHHSGSIGAKREIWKQWSSIDAVKNNRIYTLNGDLLHRFTPRAVDGLEQLCQRIDEARK
ncbi:MAG: cobalamin-binding protein [Gammaproteobacteria bacterium]|nr:MAG: cobalamin-binding protein [Gammaproteobacteria bacterium]